jgi:Flp pilus assembly pilin Flp
MIGMRKFGGSGHARLSEVSSVGQLSRPDHNESTGQTTSEYAVVLGVISVGIVIALGTLAGGISNLVNRVSGFLGA